MTQHDDMLYLGHMYESSVTVLNFAEGKLFEDLESDHVLQYAVVHALQILGEAARRVTPQTKETIPGVQWKQIIGMRHRIVHDYFDIDLEVVWDVIKNDIPALIVELNTCVPQQPEE